jgi:oligopeptide transport system substrate-binding protein
MRRKRPISGLRVQPGWLALPLVVVLLFNACSHTSSHPAATATPGLASDQTLRAALVDGPGSPVLQLSALDPAAAQSTAVHEVASLLFDGLVTTDANLGVENWGASKIGISSDGLTYTFTLRPGQHFSDGTPVTASDYAFSLDRALNPCIGSANASYLFDIKNASQYFGQLCQNGTITAPPALQGPPAAAITTLVGTSIVPDDVNGTLTITLAHPSGYFLEALTASPAYVLDPAVVGTTTSGTGWTSQLTNGSTGRGGSGMYYLANMASGGTRLTLKLNPHWWGLAAGKRPHLTEIDLTAYASLAQSAAAYQDGQVDVAVLPPAAPSQGSATATPSQPDTHVVPLATVYQLGMNWATPPMDNADARQALCLAIDRNALLRQVGAADATIQGRPTWHLIPAGMPGYNLGLSGPDGVTSVAGAANAARAHWQTYVQTLNGAQVPSVYYLSVQGSAWQGTLGTALQAQWKSVLGINVALITVAPGALTDSNTGVWAGTAHPVEWQPGYADPHEYLSPRFLPGASSNSSNVSDPAATALMQGGDTQPDQGTRVQEYQQAEQLLVREAAVCPLWQATETYKARAWVRGWSLTGLGIPADDTWLATVVVQH